MFGKDDRCFKVLSAEVAALRVVITCMIKRDPLVLEDPLCAAAVRALSTVKPCSTDTDSAEQVRAFQELAELTKAGR